MPEIKKITGEIEITETLEKDLQKNIKGVQDLGKKLESSLKSSTTELISIIFAGAILLDSSDIHLEPEENQAKIRARIDGLLQDIASFDLKIHQAIVARIKLLSGLKLNISNKPQDGRFSITFKNESIEIRASSLPTEYGESLVLRILNPKNLIDTEALGLRKDLSNVFDREIQKPNGMIIVTGPTGSGKTTTLYAILKKLNQPDSKIITIEDPIEYHLNGISQTQVEPEKGYDFANGLRSLMRQDPDIILVGEVRDLETATIALQAALTGHLVLTTMHTNDAAGTIARFQALGEKPTNIAPAINIAIAQRLVRKVCQKCVEFKKISKENLEKFKKELKSLPKETETPKLTSQTKIAFPKGCKYCNGTGYRGRIGIFEFFIVDDEMENFILTSPSISSMRALAIKKGMVSSRQDGLIKVLKGETTIEEVDRVALE